MTRRGDPDAEIAAAEAGEAAAHAALRDRLSALDLPPSAPEELAAILDRVEKAATALALSCDLATTANGFDSAAAAAVELALEAEAAAATLKGAVDKLGAWRTRAAAVARETRAAIAETMADCGLAEVLSRHHRADPIAATERVEITAPAELPAQFWRHPEPEPDKSALLVALRAGPVPGARLARGPAGVRISNRKD